MKVPVLNLDVLVQISAIVHTSEDISKVIVAAKNVSGGLEPDSFEESENLVVLEYNDMNALHYLYRKIRERQIISAARRLLLRNLVQDTTRMLVNRQVAYIGNIVLCEEEDESPLGPIIVKIESSQIMQVIDWLTTEQDIDSRTRR